jgi:hypothetical protein
MRSAAGGIDVVVGTDEVVVGRELVAVVVVLDVDVDDVELDVTGGGVAHGTRGWPHPTSASAPTIAMPAT